MCPGEGGSDWDCWNCAAASRMGCPHGLAVARRHGQKQDETKQTESKGRERMVGCSARGIVGNVVHEE